MKNKYISKQSNELLSFFQEQDQSCFEYGDALKALPQSGEGAVRELLSDMTKRGFLSNSYTIMKPIFSVQRKPGSIRFKKFNALISKKPSSIVYSNLITPAGL